jgi:hypothetical protein
MQAYASQNGATFWNSRLFLEKIRRARVAGGSERGDGHVGHEQSGDTAGCRVQRRRGAAGHEQRWAEASRGMRNAACNACALCETKGRVIVVVVGSSGWGTSGWMDGRMNAEDADIGVGMGPKPNAMAITKAKAQAWDGDGDCGSMGNCRTWGLAGLLVSGLSGPGWWWQG